MIKFPIKKSSNRVINPFQEIDNLRNEMEQIFDLSFPGFLNGGSSLIEGQWVPSLDVIDEKNHLLVKVDLPGLTKNDINVSVEDKYLTIRGEKKEDKHTKQDDFLRTERYYGRFSRSLQLPAHVDINKAKATFKDGVLELRLPKKEEYKPKQIEVDIE